MPGAEYATHAADAPRSDPGRNILADIMEMKRQVFDHRGPRPGEFEAWDLLTAERFGRRWYEPHFTVTLDAAPEPEPWPSDMIAEPVPIMGLVLVPGFVFCRSRGVHVCRTCGEDLGLCEGHR